MPSTGGSRRRGTAQGWVRMPKEFSHPRFSLSCSPPGRPSTSPHLPDVVQELGGRQAVLWAGELAAVVLEEGQQVWLQVKQPARGGPVSALGGSPLQAPWALAALQQGKVRRAWGVNSSSPSAWHASLGQLCRWPLLPLPAQLSCLQGILPQDQDPATVQPLPNPGYVLHAPFVQCANVF